MITGGPLIFGYKFELLKVWDVESPDDPRPLLALDWGAREIIPHSYRRPTFLLDYVRHRTHSRLKWVALTWLRIEYTFMFEKIIRIYTKEELIEPKSR